ncbi:uncharacterized protein LOC124289672 isoform X2 [Haliotis rubra]|uniref:uncharacterized protein LOC124289672 isoform X2 n=1 Tax=Haliotis rubra TaxID=36100 RepID=UPI001EE5A0FB|nr:uncharacterized protein LOC124289672 isoform X2 [Haliotis rubra]
MEKQGIEDSTTKQTGSARSPTVPDLLDIVEEWATKMYKVTKPEAKDIRMDIIWKKLNFTSSFDDFENKKYVKDPAPQVLLTTSFENHTKKNQPQEFEASETSTSTATTTLKRGFTRGNTGDINLTVPKKIRATASHFNEEIVINEDGKKTERTRKWKGKTSFDAIAQKNTIVQMLILQKEYHCDFTMTETLRGTVIANITSNISEVPVTAQSSIVTIFQDFKDLFPDYVTCKGNHIVWPIEGHIAFRYGVEVKTRYWYEEIPEDSKRKPQNTVEGNREDREDQSQVEDDDIAGGHVSADSSDDTTDFDGDTLDVDEDLFGYTRRIFF